MIVQYRIIERLKGTTFAELIRLSKIYRDDKTAMEYIRRRLKDKYPTQYREHLEKAEKAWRALFD